MENETKKQKITLISSIIIVIVLIVAGLIYTAWLKNQETKASLFPAPEISLNKISPEKDQETKTSFSAPKILSDKISNEISLENGIKLPVRWGDTGAQMVKAGVIDKEKFESLYNERGGLSESDKKLLYGANNENLVITQENSGIILNMLWGFGLGNKNQILENGPMVDEKYGGAGNFASTGGWTLSDGDSMSHYSMHLFVILTPEQQLLVEKVSKGIFRPCCGNSTYFPDCNHGMAMLGLLELMASQGVSEADMYKFALQVNTFWFPSQYEAIKVLFESQNIDWNTVDPRRILSAEFSSSSGYQKVLLQIKPQEQKGGAGCGA